MAFCADFGSRCVQRISDFPAAVFLADEHEDGLEAARRAAWFLRLFPADLLRAGWLGGVQTGAHEVGTWLGGTR